MCICGHAKEDHSGSGECQAAKCLCACYEEDEEETTWQQTEATQSKSGTLFDNPEAMQALSSVFSDLGVSMPTVESSAPKRNKIKSKTKRKNRSVKTKA